MKLFSGYLQIFNYLTKSTTSIASNLLLERCFLSTTFIDTENSTDIKTLYKRIIITDIIVLFYSKYPFLVYNVKLSIYNN